VNIYVEFFFVLVRAGLIALGTLFVQHGWITQPTADHFTGPAAVWITAGVSVLFFAIGQSAWSKVKAFALAKLSLLMPAGTEGVLARVALRQLSKAAQWGLARELNKRVDETDTSKIDAAMKTVKSVLEENGFTESKVPPAA
jgi:hypothetical protein